MTDQLQERVGKLRHRLTNMIITSVAFVDRGDNPEAHVVFTKHAPTEEGQTMDASEIIRKVGKVEKRSDALRVRDIIVEELQKRDPSLSTAAARVKAWEAAPELSEIYRELPPDPAPQTSTSEPVEKGLDERKEIAKEADQLQQKHPDMSRAEARSRAWGLRRDLSKSYRESISSR